MPVPRVAIVGRPNVGKSSILNMVGKRQVSIVDPTPGTTRDRVSVLIDLDPIPGEGKPLTIELTDTGGYGVYVAEGQRYNDVGEDLTRLTGDIERQIAEAVENSDVVLFVIDAQAGVTVQDQHIAQLLRRRGLGAKGRTELPIRVVTNKVDGPRWEPYAMEAAGLGFGEPLLVSAENNYLRRDFLDTLYQIVSELPGAGEPPPESPEMKIAIIGKRNAGKSTLVNTLAGEQRVIVSEIAGTTRDAVDVRFEMDGHTFIAIDTAGLRRKKSFENRIEWWAFDRVQKSIDRADVVLLLVDATEPVSQVDQQLAMLVQKTFKPTVIVVNKWDMVEGQTGQDGKEITTERFEEYLRKEFGGLPFAPVSFISGHTGLNVRETIDLAFELYNQSRMRAGTGQLNRILRNVIAKRGPISKLGTFAKVFYVAQVSTAPPTIVAVVNKPELFTVGYQRFLLNRLREQLPYPEVPIKLVVRGRRRPDKEDLAITDRARQLAEAGDQALEELSAEDEAILRGDITEEDAGLEATVEELGEDAEAYFEEE
jgi:GTPase